MQAAVLVDAETLAVPAFLCLPMKREVSQSPYRAVPSKSLTVYPAYITRPHLQAFGIRFSRVDAGTLQNAAATTELDTRLREPLSIVLKNMDTGTQLLSFQSGFCTVPAV